MLSVVFIGELLPSIWVEVAAIQSYIKCSESRILVLKLWTGGPYCSGLLLEMFMDFGAQFGKCSSVYKEGGYSICKLPSASAGIFRLSPYYGTVSSIGFSRS